MRRIVFLLAAVLGLEIAFAQKPATPTPISESSRQATQPRSPEELRALALLEPIDAHTHVATGDPSFYAMLERLHMRILDILLVDDHDPYRKTLQQQLQDGLRVVRESHGHAALCTTFDPFQFGQPDFAASAIRELDRNFADGAVAVKIWKNVGMELKDRDGHYVMPDDSAFTPILDDIESHKRTLIAHVAEPDEAWLAPDPKGLDSSYYAQNPIWYMYPHREAPKKEQILAARDHLLQQHPRLRVVGAHLGSMEDNLSELGEHLDHYPNFAVDTAARVPHLVVQPSPKVRAFILKYQDRILYATDLELLKDEAPQDVIKEWERQYAIDWRYFATNDVFDYSGHRVQGLALPKAVLRKLYHANAERWIPDLLSEKCSPIASNPSPLP